MMTTLIFDRTTQKIRSYFRKRQQSVEDQASDDIIDQLSDISDELNNDGTDPSPQRLSQRSSVLMDLAKLFRSSSCASKRTLMDDDDKGMSKDRILNEIRQKKEAIIKLKCQPWSMHRKRRALKVAHRYLEKQQLEVSKCRLLKAEISRFLTLFGRWCSNMKIYIIPWEAKIKGIESHYGSVVSSYFTFLRWILSVNITMTVIMMLFVTIPEWLADSRNDLERFNRTRSIKVMKPEDERRADELNTIIDFKGYFEYSLMFYGFYSNETYVGDIIKYSVPVAYFTVNLFILGYSFFVILRRMAANARNSRLAEGKAQQYIFNWRLFTGWDYTIGNPEAVSNVRMSAVIQFRESIAEYNVNKKKSFNFLQTTLRILANLLVLILLSGSVFAILKVSQIKTKTTFLERNAVSITVSFITLTFPNFFDLISKLERYHPRTALRLQLGRILFLYIVNYYTLIVSLMFMLDTMESQRAHGQQLFLANSPISPNYMSPTYDTSSFIPSNKTKRELLHTTSNHSQSAFNHSILQQQLVSIRSYFGPIAVANPNAVVTEGSKADISSSQFEALPIGNFDWSQQKNIKPTFLNYTTNHYAISSMQVREWYDECWENLIGQEITKLVTMDLIMTIASILVIDFFRALWVRHCNLWWFWNLERTFPEYGEFKVAENVLHLVNNQGMIWLGLFFVPMLPAMNNIKLIILMYLRAWAVMTCNVPAQQIFRASRSSNFYLILLLLMLFLCTLPVGYVIASKKPSRICGPFSRQERFYSVIVQLMDRHLSKGLMGVIKYSASPGIIIPVLLLLVLIIYFLFALVRGLREANCDLSKQLVHERTEEKKRIYRMAGGSRREIKTNMSESGNARKTINCDGAVPLKASSTTDGLLDIKLSGKDEAQHSSGIVYEDDLSAYENADQIFQRGAKRNWKQKFINFLAFFRTRHQSAHASDDVNVEMPSSSSIKSSDLIVYKQPYRDSLVVRRASYMSSQKKECISPRAEDHDTGRHSPSCQQNHDEELMRLSDPRLYYAEPSSSYANAMLLPLIEQAVSVLSSDNFALDVAKAVENRNNRLTKPKKSRDPSEKREDSNEMAGYKAERDPVKVDIQTSDAVLQSICKMNRNRSKAEKSRLRHDAQPIPIHNTLNYMQSKLPPEDEPLKYIPLLKSKQEMQREPHAKQSVV